MDKGPVLRPLAPTEESGRLVAPLLPQNLDSQGNRIPGARWLATASESTALGSEKVSALVNEVECSQGRHLTATSGFSKCKQSTCLCIYMGHVTTHMYICQKVNKTACDLTFRGMWEGLFGTWPGCPFSCQGTQAQMSPTWE